MSPGTFRRKKGGTLVPRKGGTLRGGVHLVCGKGGTLKGEQAWEARASAGGYKVQLCEGGFGYAHGDARLASAIPGFGGRRDEFANGALLRRGDSEEPGCARECERRRANVTCE